MVRLQPTMGHRTLHQIMDVSHSKLFIYSSVQFVMRWPSLKFSHLLWSLTLTQPQPLREAIGVSSQSQQSFDQSTNGQAFFVFCPVNSMKPFDIATKLSGFRFQWQNFTIFLSLPNSVAKGFYNSLPAGLPTFDLTHSLTTSYPGYLLFQPPWSEGSRVGRRDPWNEVDSFARLLYKPNSSMCFDTLTSKASRHFYPFLSLQNTTLATSYNQKTPSK